jgi:hypothetical protein
MPTGFTAEVGDGKLTEFPDFVKRCARGMGALVMMRDEPLDAPFPERIKPDLSYHREQLERSTAQLAEVVAWDAETSEAKANSAHVQNMIGYLKGVREDRQTRARYMGMLTQVEAWEPPTEDHVGLKKFMTEQLTGSIGFDTGYYEDPESRRPQRMTGEEYRTHQLEYLARSIQYNTEHLFGEIDRADGRDEWIQQLSGSLQAWQPVEVPVRYLP